MRTPVKVAALMLVAALALAPSLQAQTGTWQLQVKRVGQPKESGYAWISLNADGSVTGYALTTLSFGVATTTSGVWVIDAKGLVAAVNLEGELNGQLINGVFQAKVKGDKLSGHALGSQGEFKVKGVPATQTSGLGGHWVGTVTQGRITVPESFDAVESPDFPGIYDISGTGVSPNGTFTFTGQTALGLNGRSVGYSVSDFGAFTVAAYFTGKPNATGGVTVKGVDENGVTLKGSFSR